MLTDEVKYVHPASLTGRVHFINYGTCLASAYMLSAYTSKEAYSKYAHLLYIGWDMSPEGREIIKDGMRQNVDLFICSDPRSCLKGIRLLLIFLY
jgi:hypothetical protein